ncbi:MAG TPA: chorismate mutase, partial [Polyangiaceae bacterium]|nr:chorismate mutase [Polyangiaceae bacterium]
MSDHKREVEELRVELGRIDGQILAALEKRAKTSRRIGELRHGHPAQLPLTDRAQIATVLARASGEMPVEDLRVIFAQVYASCLALEVPVKVAYLAPEGG